MQKICECGCGQAFEAVRRSARFASTACRVRANRAQKRQPVKLAAVHPIAAPAPANEPRHQSLAEAIEGGSLLEILTAQRREIAKSLAGERGPALAALHRQLVLISERITALERADQEASGEDGAPDDEALDTATL